MDLPGDEPMGFDLLAARLRSEQSDNHSFLQALAVRLDEALPGLCDVERQGGFLRRDHPVQRLVVRLGDEHFQLEHQRGDRLVARVRKVVRGIALSSAEMDLDGWLQALSQALRAFASRSDVAHEALERFLIDGETMA